MNPSYKYTGASLEKRKTKAISRQDIWFIFLVLVFITLRVTSSGTADLAYLALVVYALRGREQAIHALLLSWLFFVISPGIAPDSRYGGLLRYAIVASAVISVFFRGGYYRSSEARKFLFLTFWLGTFLVVHSIVISYSPGVSILKSLSWVLTVMALSAAWQGLGSSSSKRVERHVFGLLIVMLLASLLLFYSPLGYLRNGTGFQGVFNHPQGFGPAMAVLGAWVAARIFSEPKPAWSPVALLGVCVVVIMASEARTAGFSLVLGVLLSLVLSPIFAGRSLKVMAPGLGSRRVVAMAFVVLVSGIALAPVIGDKLHHYVTKSGRAEVGGVLEAYDKSRGSGIRLMFQNFEQHPFTGIGFGVASIPESMVVRRDPLFNLPISASVEKGVTPVAVLEELGLFGAVLVGWWMLMLLKGSARSGLVPFAVCLTVLLINMGEATLFSPGGMGMLYLIVLTWAYARGQAAQRQCRRERS